MRRDVANVANIVLRTTDLSAVETTSRAVVLRRLRGHDAVFRILTRSAAVSVLVILGGVIVALVSGALPALHAFGIGFLTTSTWNPVTEKFDPDRRLRN